MKYTKPLLAVGLAMSTITSAAPVPRGGRRAQAPMLMRRDGDTADGSFRSDSRFAGQAAESEEGVHALLRRSSEASETLAKRSFMAKFAEWMNKTPKNPDAWKWKLAAVMGGTGLATWWVMDKKSKKDDEWYEYAGIKAKPPQPAPVANQRIPMQNMQGGQQGMQGGQQGMMGGQQGMYQQGMQMNQQGMYQQGMPVAQGTMPMAQNGMAGNRRSLDEDLVRREDAIDVESALFRRGQRAIVYYVPPQAKPEHAKQA